MAESEDRSTPGPSDGSPVAASLQESVARQGVRAALRTMIAGYVDAYSLLTVGVFASFMTGNTTTGGVRLAQGILDLAGRSLLPIPFFILGIISGTLLVQTDQVRAPHRISAIVAILLATDLVGKSFTHPAWLSIVVLSAAMGILNTSITIVGGQEVSLGFITGDLNNLAKQVAMRIAGQPVPHALGPSDTHWRRAGILAALWCAFFVGTVLGATATSRLAASTLLWPTLALFILALLERAGCAPAQSSRRQNRDD